MQKTKKKIKEMRPQISAVNATVAVTVVFFVLNILSGGVVLEFLKLKPTSILHPLELWKLLSVALVHGSISHIFFNMYSLWLFGSGIEKEYGPKFFMSLYLFALVGSSVFWCLLQLASGDITPAVGASGGITGLITFYTLAFPDRKFFIIPFPFPIPAWLLGVVIVGQDMSGLLKTNEFGSDGIAYTAHLGGAICGIIFYFCTRKLVQSKKKKHKRHV